MTVLEIQAGDLTAAPGRTITGLLVPYGETGRTNLGRVVVDPGTIDVPVDPAVVTLNTDHHRNRPVGRARDLLATAAGIVATFDVARTPEGDDLLAEVADPDRPDARRSLSVELADVVIRAGRLVRGRLYAAAAVTVGAFPSAVLHAADVDPDAAPELAGEPVPDTVTINGRTFALTPVPDPATDPDPAADPDADPAADPDADPDADPAADPDADPDADPEHDPAQAAPADPTEGTDPMTTTTPARPAPARPADARPAAAPADLHASMGVTGGTSATRPLGVRDVARLMSRAMETRDHDLLARLGSPEVTGPADLFAALSDVKYDTASSVGSSVNAQPAWLGELWSGRAYQRRIIPLLGAVAPLTSLKIAGWRWVVKPEGGTWTGNKTNVPSNAPSTTDAPTTARRFAGAHDHAREFVDFPNPDYWESYWRAMTESYARWSDNGCLDDLVAAATPNRVTPGAVPTGVSVGMGRIVDGALAIVERAVPTFALVANDLYRDLLLTRNDDTLTYLNAALGLEDGTVSTFRVAPAARLAPGSVLVGAREAATPHELPGTPVRVDALDMVRGGVDTGLFGYYGTVVHDPQAVALVAPAPAPS